MSQETQSGATSGVPSAAMPKTTAVLVIETAKQGVNPQQIMAVIPAEIRATRSTSTGKFASGIRAAMAKVSSSWLTQRLKPKHEPLWKPCRSRRNS
jgi:hypothetical protein